MKIGRYVAEEEIGSGSTSSVYLGRDGEETVALKVLHRHLSRDPLVRERFRREAEVSRTLIHPGIVEVYDLLTWEDRDVAVMEYCTGGSLADRKIGNPGDWLRIIREAAEALACAHAHGIIHRDIKPRNILFSAPPEGDWRVKLCDFGSARIQNLIGITTSTMFIGTPQFVPPESLAGAPSDPRGDLYSLGAVAYQMLTGSPHTGTSLSALFRPKNSFPSPRELNPAVPAWLSDLVMKLLGPLESRPSGARALLAILDSRVVPPPEGTKTCLFCGRMMPEDAPVCLSCGEAEIEIVPYHGSDAESIVLTKVPEQVEIIDHFFHILRAVSGNPALTFSFITEDPRMYSSAEKKQSIQLPVRILDNLSPGTVNALLPVIEGKSPAKKSAAKIGLKRYPASKAARKVKRGPLISPRPMRTGSTSGTTFLQAMSPRENPKPVAAGKPLHRELHSSCLLASYRLIRECDDPDVVGQVNTLAGRVGEVLGKLQRLGEALSSVSLGEIYADIQRLEVKAGISEDPGELDTLHRLLEGRKTAYEQYLEQERSYAKLAGSVLEVIRELEELAAACSGAPEKERIAKELEEIMRELA